MRYFSFPQRQDRRVRNGFTDFKIPLHTCCISRRCHVLLMPFIGGFRKLRRIFAYGPRSPLVETDGQSDIQVGIVGGVETGYIIVRYGIRYLTLRNLHNQVFYRDAVITYLVDVDAATQFFVQIDKALIVLSGFYVYILSDEFRYVFQRFGTSACTLYNDLMGNHFLTAIYQTVFPFFGDGQVIGYEVAFACKKLFNQVMYASGHFNRQLDAETFGKLFAQFILKTHVLTAIDKVGRGAV